MSNSNSMAIAPPLPPPRVVISTHKNDGSSTFAHDTPASQFQPFGPSSTIFSIFHSTPQVPASNQTPSSLFSPSAYAQTLPRCPPSGAIFCTTDFAPNDKRVPMHRTRSLDYGVVLKGEIVMILDGEGGKEEERVLKEGDVVVGRGTNHRWENRTGQWCRVLVVMVASQDVVLGDGTVLEETVFGPRK